MPVRPILSLLAFATLGACAGGGAGGPAGLPRPMTGRYDLFIRGKVQSGEIGMCAVPALQLANTRSTISFSTKARLGLPVTYSPVTFGMLGHHQQLLGGDHAEVWPWIEGFQLLPQETWSDIRSGQRGDAAYVLQMTSGAGYLPFSVADTWDFGRLEECSLVTQGGPARVLLFTLVKGQETVYGVEAYWRNGATRTWVSFLGMGTEPEAQGEFIAIIRNAT